MAAPTRISADAAAALVRSGDWVDYGFGMGQPDLFDRALAARAAELRGVKIRSCLTHAAARGDRRRPDAASTSSGSTGTSPATTASSTTPGRCNYIPMNFGEAPDYYRRFIDRVDVVVHQDLPDGRRTATSTSAAPSPTRRP